MKENEGNDSIVRAENITLIIMDVDGTLTDGRIFIGQDGETVKGFDVRDGLGIDLWHKCKKRSGIITGRKSPIVEKRAYDLNIAYVYQGQTDKCVAYQMIKEDTGYSDEMICYIGDDLPDIPLLRQVGLAIAVGDAAEEVKHCAHLVTDAPGGYGAVREAIEFILKAQGLWNKAIFDFYR